MKLKEKLERTWTKKELELKSKESERHEKQTAGLVLLGQQQTQALMTLLGKHIRKMKNGTSHENCNIFWNYF